MPIDLQEIINRVTLEKTADVAAVSPVAPVAPVAAEVVVPVAATEVVAPVALQEPTLEEQQKVAAEMDAAGRIMARAFHDELGKLANLTKTAVGAHGYVDTAAELPETPIQVSKQPERLENAMKAVSIIQQLTAGERVHGTEGYVQVNGQPVDATAPEVDEHPTVNDPAAKHASADIITAVYDRFFGGK
jgi:hypothetical protein